MDLPTSPDAVQAWGWGFLGMYICIMLVCGYIGMRRTASGDDFAVARESYGPLTLALCMTASVASGATFLGTPGWAYEFGLSTLWYTSLYPLAVYGGMFFTMATLRRGGSLYRSRSIPELLGDRYRSTFLRLTVAGFSLVMLFYVAGQFIAGSVVFAELLGLGPLTAMLLTATVLMVYVAGGGSHADILSDMIQGALMVGISMVVAGLFFSGWGIPGGFPALLERLGRADPESLAAFNPRSPIAGSWWAVCCILVAHLPFGLLPHQANRLWALKGDAARHRFIAYSLLFGLLLPLIALGGLLARATLGDILLENGRSTNEAIPALLIEVLPPWLAALFTAGVLAAVMSTADGLVISCSQVIANDFYRRTFAARWRRNLTTEELDRRVLKISRLATVAVLLAALGLGWLLRQVNITQVVWIGLGGMMAALSGPLLLGSLRRDITRAGAEAGAVVGLVTFVVIKLQLVGVLLYAGAGSQSLGGWLASQGENPFAATTLGIAASLLATGLVSAVTKPLPEEHLAAIFPEPRRLSTAGRP